MINNTSILSLRGIRITLWSLFGLGLIGLVIIGLQLLGGSQSASFALQARIGTCYRFDPAVGRAPLFNITPEKCAKDQYWYEYCYNGKNLGDSRCLLRKVEENRGQVGPDFDKLADTTRGWCQLENPNVVIKDITYRSCRNNTKWAFFSANKALYYRRGAATINYRNKQAQLHDQTANCVLDKKQKPSNICVNSLTWCAYDNPTFCLKR